jgi:hypothetical protein
MSLVLQSLLPFPDSCQGRNPHQQGRGTKMKERCYGGIDVSKDRLDGQVLPQGRSFSVDNTAAGWSQLVYGLRGLSIGYEDFTSVNKNEAPNPIKEGSGFRL